MKRIIAHLFLLFSIFSCPAHAQASNEYFNSHNNLQYGFGLKFSMLFDMQQHHPNPYFRLSADAGIASTCIADWLYIDGVAVNSHLGIPYVIETMKYLNSKCPGKQEFDNLAIGTDFDGLATNPKDLYLNRQLADLVGAMKKDKAFKPEYIAKTVYGNVRRGLENGWGEGPDRPTVANS